MTGRAGDLSRLMRPRSIAFVGGSQIAGPIRACRRAGYDGQMWVVNPSKPSIEGIACVASIDTLPAPPDAAIVGLAPERSIDAVKALARAGAGGAVVMSSGFAELRTDEGRQRQDMLKQAADDMPLLGPNCMGLINQFSGAAVWGDDNHIERQDGPAAAIISQSGALLIGITNVELAFPLGYAISLGNQAVTTMADCIDAVLEDSRIRAIGLYVEGLDDGEAFGRACLRAHKRNVPIVALKGGDGAEGSKVSLSHTASMVVERDIWEAFCSRYGIEEVTSPKALVETLKLLTVAGPPKGNRVSIVSYSGGLNGLAAAAATRNGLMLPAPSEPNMQTLAASLPETVAINNPLDLNIPYRSSSGGISMQDTEGVAGALVAFAEDISDQLVFFIDVPRPGAAGLDTVWCDSLEALIEVRKRLDIPVSVAGILPEGLPADFRRHMNANGVAALAGYSETMEALVVSARIAANQQGDALAGQSTSLITGPEPRAPRMLDELQSMNALSEFGLIFPEHRNCTPAEASRAAKEIGFPVAVKVLSSEIAHKARVGGVALGLDDEEQVERACQRIAEAVQEAGAGEIAAHLLVERMVKDADEEIILGIKRHPAMGLALMVGRGGSNAESLAEFSTMLLPLSDCELERALTNLGLAKHPAVGALRSACKAVADFAVSHCERLTTLDVNPVILTRDGEAIAADALVCMSDVPQNHETRNSELETQEDGP